MAVIVAVEGPSAAGKSTWCRATSEQFVAEYTPTGEEPDGSDPAEQATHWAQVNAQRWTQALTLQAATGVAV
ncbi:uridine kinase [Rhodococcus opacus]|nr:uridine kinase [Rhodococcus opacus]